MKQALVEEQLDSLRRGARRLFAPINIGMLVYFRMAFGGVMVWEAYRYLSHGWIDSQFREPQVFFSYYGFEWLRPWSGNGMVLHFVALGILAAMIAAGLFYRMATVLFFLGFTYVFLLDQAHYLNHFYLISLLSFLLIFLPAHRAGSLDVLRRPELRTTSVPAWTLWLLRFQIAVPYFFGGLAKLNSDWLQGEPMRHWLANHFGRPLPEPVVYLFAWGGMLFDLLIVPALLWKPTRLPAFVAAILFHLTNHTLFHIGIFPWLMLAASILFFPPEWLAIEGDDPQRSRRQPIPTAIGQRRILVLLGVWVAVQCLVPLRHLLYPGNVSWTEEGHRFAWHMKLRDKSADWLWLTVTTESGRLLTWEWRPRSRVPRDASKLHFRATDLSGEALPQVDDPAANLLTHAQLRGVATKPDMLLQLAHLLAERVRSSGDEPTGVFADARVSLNGRPPLPLIDPHANLLRVSRDLKPASWIRPLTAPLPLP